MELPKRKRNRLPDYDYCTPNAYFITICLKDRKNLLWQAPTISHLINQFKGTVTKKIGQSIWQKGFYDHIIRDENDYQSAWRYIVGNAAKLAEQKNWEYLILSEE